MKRVGVIDVNLEHPELNADNVQFLSTDAKVREDTYKTKALLILKDNCRFSDVKAGLHMMYWFESEPNVIYEQLPAIPQAVEEDKKYEGTKKHFGMKRLLVDMAEQQATQEMKSRPKSKWNKWVLPKEVKLTNKEFTTARGGALVPEIVVMNNDGATIDFPNPNASSLQDQVLTIECKQDTLRLRFLIALAGTCVKIKAEDNGEENIMDHIFHNMKERMSSSKKKKKAKGFNLDNYLSDLDL